MEPFLWSGWAIWVCQRAPKRIQNGQKRPFSAISGSGRSKLAKQFGTRVEQVRAHPLCIGTVLGVREGHMGVPEGLQRGPKRPKTAFLGPHIPRRPFLTCETVSLHRPGCALTCFTYILHCSISSDHQTRLWHQNGHFKPFGTILGSYWGPPTAPLTPETVPMHHWGCALTCSTYIPHCSASLEPHHLLMATK